MANEEQLKILKQGVEVWNQWREEHPDVRPDLHAANLSEANLIKANFEKANLTKTNFERANLENANIEKAELVDANLRRTNLKRANLEGTDLRNADLAGADLWEANLSEADLRGADLAGSELWGADFAKANLRRVNLRRANIVRVNFNKADITGVNLYGTARDDWSINDIICNYVFWDLASKKRTPPDKDFRPGEFEELYRSLPTFEYVFEHGFTPIDVVVMDRVVQAINDKHPEFELKLSTLDSRGQPHAVFTVVHKDHVEAAQHQVTTDFERRLAALEGKQEQMMELFARIADNPKTIELILGDKRMIQAGQDYFEQVAGDVTTGKSASKPKKEP